MTDWLRRGGRGRLPNDDVVLWSVAEGKQGRRWRWMRHVSQELMGPSGMLELLPDGRLGRLELAYSGGLLTFHPEPDGQSAHGNVVTRDGVKPIETAWRPEWRIGIIGDQFGSAVAGWAGAGMVFTFQGDSIVWRDPGEHPDVEALDDDERGIPILDDAQDWPLEE